MTPFFVKKCAKLFKALRDRLEIDLPSVIPLSRTQVSLPALRLFSLSIQIAAAFLLATDDGAGAGPRGDGRLSVCRPHCRILTVPPHREERGQEGTAAKSSAAAGEISVLGAVAAVSALMLWRARRQGMLRRHHRPLLPRSRRP